MRIGNNFLVAGAALQIITRGIIPILKMVNVITNDLPNNVRPTR